MEFSLQQAFDCFRSDDLIGIGMEADAIRRRLHPGGVVSYRCLQEIQITGGQNGLGDPDLCPATLRLNCRSASSLHEVAEFCAEARRRHPYGWIEIGLGFDAVFDERAAKSMASWAAAGANSIFVDPRHESASYAAITSTMLAIHRVAHALCIRTTVAIPFGCGESLPERLACLEAVRLLQEETGGFVGFVPLGVDALGGRELDGVTAVERLKMIAVCRIFLHNIQHLQSVQVGPGLKVLQAGLRFGADDTELRLTRSGPTEQELRRVIRDAGFRPVERDGPYFTTFLG
jgi:cyclic dehypoxanthinyl futalosine synthase